MIPLVSQFTLLAKTTKGTKPDFHGAANPEEARRLYQYFIQKVQAGYQADRVKDGRFQAMMEVALVNDGPVRQIRGDTGFFSFCSTKRCRLLSNSTLVERPHKKIVRKGYRRALRKRTTIELIIELLLHIVILSYRSGIDRSDYAT